MVGPQDFSLSPSSLGLGLQTKDLGPGLDNNILKSSKTMYYY